MCKKCREQFDYGPYKFEVEGIKMRALYRYQDFTRTQMIQYKERFDELLSRVLIYPEKFRLNLFYNDYKIVYVPTTQESIKRRGFDHMGLIAASFGLEVLSDILWKEASVKQSTLKFDERHQVSQYFHVYPDVNLSKTKVLLIDDVCTTGASLVATYRLLEPVCKRVRVLVLCVHPLLLEP